MPTISSRYALAASGSFAALYALDKNAVASWFRSDRFETAARRRRGGGRPKGTPNRATRAWRESVELMNGSEQQQALADAIKAPLLPEHAACRAPPGDIKFGPLPRDS
jgi:hypothetical protein